MFSSKALYVAAVAVLLTGCVQNPPTAASTDPAKAAPVPVVAPVVEAAPVVEPPKPLVMAAGVSIKVRTTTALSTKTQNAGDAFTATLTQPVIVDGKTIAKVGSEVDGVVVESDPGGKVKGVANISVRLTRLHMGARSLAIRTNSLAFDAPASKKKDAAEVGIVAGIGAAIGAAVGGGEGAAIGAASGAGAGGAVVLSTRGNSAVIPSETLLSFRLSGPLTISE
ncbi:MAG: hypothetical protein ABI824_19930 [Acidobacteriota bacterium]